jgi:hypothetical protein
MIDNKKQKTNSGTGDGFKNLTTSQKVMVIGVICLMPLVMTHFTKRKRWR